MPRRSGAADSATRAFGAVIKSVRLASGQTLDQVAERAGVTDGRYIGEIERGWHSPTIATAKRIADALDVPLADLVQGL